MDFKKDTDKQNKELKDMIKDNTSNIVTFKSEMEVKNEELRNCIEDNTTKVKEIDNKLTQNAADVCEIKENIRKI